MQKHPLFQNYRRHSGNTSAAEAVTCKYTYECQIYSARMISQPMPNATITTKGQTRTSIFDHLTRYMFGRKKHLFSPQSPENTSTTNVFSALTKCNIQKHAVPLTNLCSDTSNHVLAPPDVLITLPVLHFEHPRKTMASCLCLCNLF